MIQLLQTFKDGSSKTQNPRTTSEHVAGDLQRLLLLGRAKPLWFHEARSHGVGGDKDYNYLNKRRMILGKAYRALHIGSPTQKKINK